MLSTQLLIHSMAREPTIRGDDSSDSGDDFHDGDHEPMPGNGGIDTPESDDELHRLGGRQVPLGTRW